MRHRVGGQERDETPRGSLPDRSLVLTLAVVFLLSCAPLASATSQGIDLRTTTPLEISGSLEVDSDGSALHILDAGDGVQLHLEAGIAKVNYSWERGFKSSTGGEKALVTYVTDDGNTTEVFRNVEISVSPGEHPVQYLAFPTQGSPTTHVKGVGTTVIAPDTPATLATIGESEDTQSTDDDTFGFWYRPSQAWMSGTGADEAVMVGDFSVFINNATVSVHQDGDLAWKNWTGYRESSSAVAATTYEHRLLVLELRDARLRVSDPGKVQFLGPSFDVAATGAVTASNVEGQMKTSAGQFLFSQDPLRLRGNGSFSITKVGGDSPGLGVEMFDAESFEVQGKEPIQPASTGSSPETEQSETNGLAAPAAPGASSILPKVLGGLGLLLLAGVAVGAHTTGATSRWYGALQDRRFESAMAEAQSRARDRAFDAAASSFRRATDIKPDHTMAWFQLALSHLEAGNYGTVLEVLEESRNKAPMDNLDLLEIEIEASLQLGDIQRCRRALAELAEGSEAMAKTLVRDLELEDAIIGDDLRDRLSSNKEPGGLPGYV